MSIEQTLERIATALETIAKACDKAPAAAPTAAPAAAKPATTKAAKPTTGMTAPAATPVVAPQPEHDPFAQEAEVPVPTITIQQLEESLRHHAKAFGTPTTLALMVKHGADRAKTTIKSIPTVGYQPLNDEIEADLKKQK